VKTSVKIGADWVRPPPRVIEIDRSGATPAVDIEWGIGANPRLEKVVLTAHALGIDAVDLETIETAPFQVPEGARLEFAIGVVEPDWGFDPVRFSVEACEGERCETVWSSVYEPTGADRSGWRDESVSLADFAGRKLHFRFLARRQTEEAPFSFPVWANPTVWADAPRRPGTRNVILLSIDTLRADHLSAYGYQRDTSPFIARRFAEGGTFFDHLVASATITTPSHASMFTALSPAAHGAVHGVKRLPKQIPTLAELVRHAGIETAAFTEDGWLGVEQGFGRGFNRYIENKSAHIMEPTGQADRTFGQARAWLLRNADRPFFLFIHTFQVHTPYAPPPDYQQLFLDGGDVEIPPHLEWMTKYDQEIRYTDDELAKLFETIDALGLAENTVFILTSDHGEAFLEHGLLEHGSLLTDEVVRVPLMFWGAGIPAGRRVDATVSHVDLLPTILEILGVGEPPAREGTSLLALVEGSGDGAAFDRRPVYSESRLGYALGPDRMLHDFPTPSFLVRVGDLKLARYPQKDGTMKYELYDVAADPLERHNLYHGDDERVRPLEDLLEKYDPRGERIRTRLLGGRPAEDQEPVMLDPEQEEKLRALGYVIE
jgi:arylsulfatase A-like enzyme